MAQPRADLLVHRIELREHAIGHRIIDARLRTKREVAALPHGPWRHVLEQAQAQRGADVEGVALDRRPQRFERTSILPRLHVHQAKLHRGLAPLGCTVPRPLQEHRSVLVLTAPRQHAPHLERCVRAAGGGTIGIGEGLLHRLGAKAHGMHRRQVREGIRMRGCTREHLPQHRFGAIGIVLHQRRARTQESSSGTRGREGIDRIGDGQRIGAFERARAEFAAHAPGLRQARVLRERIGQRLPGIGAVVAGREDARFKQHRFPVGPVERPCCTERLDHGFVQLRRHATGHRPGLERLGLRQHEFALPRCAHDRWHRLSHERLERSA